jgi:hypothetical protein
MAYFAAILAEYKAAGAGYAVVPRAHRLANVANMELLHKDRLLFWRLWRVVL